MLCPARLDLKERGYLFQEQVDQLGLERAADYLREQRGKHFQPELVDLFLEQIPALLEVKARWAEH